MRLLFSLQGILFSNIALKRLYYIVSKYRKQLYFRFWSIQLGAHLINEATASQYVRYLVLGTSRNALPQGAWGRVQRVVKRTRWSDCVPR